MINTVTLYGRLVNDARLVQNPNWKAAFLTLAVDMGANKDGTRKTDFVPVVAWGNLAEGIAAHNHKGDAIVVNGHIAMDNRKTEDGKTNSVMTIVVDSYAQGVRKGTLTKVGAGQVAPTAQTAPAQPVKQAQPQAATQVQQPVYNEYADDYGFEEYN